MADFESDTTYALTGIDNTVGKILDELLELRKEVNSIKFIAQQNQVTLDYLEERSHPQPESGGS